MNKEKVLKLYFQALFMAAAGASIPVLLDDNNEHYLIYLGAFTITAGILIYVFIRLLNMINDSNLYR